MSRLIDQGRPRGFPVYGRRAPSLREAPASVAQPEISTCRALVYLLCSSTLSRRGRWSYAPSSRRTHAARPGGLAWANDPYSRLPGAR